MNKRCEDCGVKPALQNDYLCQECREDMNEFSDRAKVVYKIHWQKYDPSKPISHIKYVVTNGDYVRDAYHARYGDLGYTWGDGTTALYPDVTHYAPINLPGEG